jgi:hypothetical protein
MKQIPNTPGGWMHFVSRVKELIDYPLNADLYSIMMREYYILGKSPQDYVNSLK